jgi:hypothetical protein
MSAIEKAAKDLPKNLAKAVRAAAAARRKQQGSN